MLNYHKILIATLLVLTSNLVFAQSYKVIDYLTELSGEILKVEIQSIDTCSSYNACSCTSLIKSRVIGVLKNTKFNENIKRFNFTHTIEHNWKEMPKDKMLKVGQVYIVFVSSELLTREDVKSHAYNVYYSLVDYFFGIVAYNSDLENYLKLTRQSKG